NSLFKIIVKKKITDAILSVPEKIGSVALKNIRALGKAGFLFIEAIIFIFMPPFRWKIYFQQLEFIGNKSLNVVLLTGLFTGAVLSLQMYVALKSFGSESVVGGIVALSMTREMGPVLTSLMVAARAGSAIAAQLGTMRVTEQISALDAMAVNSVQYLISPRVFAGFFILPFLTICSEMVGIIGGYIISVGLFHLDSGIYIAKIIDFVALSDILGGLLKSSVFGVILTFTGCYKGYNTYGGAEGVGNATTEAVVNSMILIFISDYIMTSFLLIG
ncbi:MAG: phospholipid/cholesterol/gamma-HCH transport system permease protein, partial [bacterium]